MPCPDPTKFCLSYGIAGDLDDEMLLLSKLLKAIYRVISVGANCGVYAYPFEKLRVHNAKYINNSLFLHEPTLNRGCFDQLFHRWSQR